MLDWAIYCNPNEDVDLRICLILIALLSMNVGAILHPIVFLVVFQCRNDIIFS